MAFLLKSITSSAPTQLTGVNTFIKGATFYGFSGFIGGVPQPNIGTLYLGPEPTRFPIVINRSGNHAFTTPQGSHIKENLTNFWVSGSTNDGVYVWYY